MCASCTDANPSSLNDAQNFRRRSAPRSQYPLAFCRLLGFQLLPRLKAIAAQRLYLPEAGGASLYPNLACILAKMIDWDLIEQQYDEMVRYATAMAERTADPE